MATVDIDDDDLRRFVVHHYRYDPERHERRHVLVGAFDDAAEARACFDRVRADLERRRETDPGFDRREHVSSRTLEPGDRRRDANSRLLRRTIRHGVTPGDWADDLELPSSTWLMRFGRDPGRRATAMLRWRLRRWREGR
ncbi:hypothetical protein [Oryzihumus sp.]|uniref:hypothetical protein n=1 Tax=Oryzihumus sp. TaxID=1968903 RepID=UPI002ED98F6F